MPRIPRIIFGNLVNKNAGANTDLSVWVKFGYSGSKLCHLIGLLLVSSPVNNSVSGSSAALVLLTLRCKHHSASPGSLVAE